MLQQHTHQVIDSTESTPPKTPEPTQYNQDNEIITTPKIAKPYNPFSESQQ